MRLDQIRAGDVLASTDENGTGFYRVLKVCKVKVRVETEQGYAMLAYPHHFDRHVLGTSVPGRWR